MVGTVARGGERKQKFHGKCIRTHLGSARHSFALALRRASGTVNTLGTVYLCACIIVAVREIVDGA